MGNSPVAQWLGFYTSISWGTGLIPALGRSPGEGNGDTLQYSCMENSMDRGAWWARVQAVTKSWTQLSD